MKKKATKIILLSFFVIPILFIIFAGGYTYWNAANPQQTCASCHEISPSHDTWASLCRVVSIFSFLIPYFLF